MPKPHHSLSGVRQIVVHCAATPHDRIVTAADVDRWHRGNGWSGIGYHFFIRRSGLIEPGRALAFDPNFGVSVMEKGAHVRGHNHNSIGICLAGGLGEDWRPTEGASHYAPEQLQSLRTLIATLLLMLKDEVRVLGHRDMPNVSKACPCFDVREWLLDWG